MAGLSSQGLEIKTLDDVITDNQTQATTLFSDLVPAGGAVDVGPNGALGRLIGVVSPSQADLWELAQLIYNSFNPATAFGVSLDNIVALGGVNRLSASPTQAQVILEGTTGTVISSPEGKASSSTTKVVYSIETPVTLTPTLATGVGISVSVVADNTNYVFQCAVDGANTTIITYNSGVGATEAAILDGIKVLIDTQIPDILKTYYKQGILFADGVDQLQTANFTVSSGLMIGKVRKPGIVVADVVGPTVQAVGTIDTISVPILGWDSITNPVEAATGSDSETDAELRERFRNSKYTQATNIIEALYSELLAVVGVTQLVIYENDTDVTDDKGILPHSFMVLVNGGFSQDIGKAIWENKPVGIRSQGDTSVVIVDKYGNNKTVNFSRPTSVDLYITMDIETTALFPETGYDTIRQNIANYFNSYPMGQEVLYSRLYTPINAVPGHYINSLFVGKNPNPTETANVALAYNEVVRVLPQNIIFT